MLVPPKSLIRLGAGYFSARTSRRLHRTSVDFPAQERARRSLSDAFGRTEFGREHGIDGSTDYQAFTRKVPLRGYEQFEPYITRMKCGEANVLASGPCRFFATSSGATTGRPKHLPVNQAMFAHFHRAAREALLFYTARTGHHRIFDGRFLFLGGSGDLVWLDSPECTVMPLGGLATVNLPRWAERHYCEPGAAIAGMADWADRLEAMVERTRPLDIRLIAGLPGRLLALARRLESAPPAVWPELECVVHGGAPANPFADALREAFGPRARLHEVYSSAEGFIAAQDMDREAGLRLMTDAGIFYEFLPLDAFDEKRLDSLGAKAVPLEGVRTGIDYAVVLTTPAGLARYVLGDIVRFTSANPARLLHMGRTRLRLNPFGERVTERDLADALLAVCRRHNWTIVNFHVAPLRANAVTGQGRGRHEWWVELKPMTTETPTGPLMAAELDEELRRSHEHYAARRRDGAVEPPLVRLVMPGVFDQWMQENDRPGGRDKMPRCRSDRLIADPLARIARFSAD